MKMCTPHTHTNGFTENYIIFCNYLSYGIITHYSQCLTCARPIRCHVCHVLHAVEGFVKAFHQ